MSAGKLGANIAEVITASDNVIAFPRALLRVAKRPMLGLRVQSLIGFAQLIDALAAHYIERKIDLVLGIEARGFIFGPALAYRLNAGFVPVRKPRKLPAPVARVTYDLEYGSDTLEIHMDAIQPGQRVVLVDDLLATGGTMEATVKLVNQLGGEITGLAFAVELDFLKGRDRFKEYDVFSLLHYDE